MKVLLTGAAGKLGSAVCRLLHEKGIELRATDHVPNRKLPVPLHLAELLQPIECHRLVDGIDAVVHLANHTWSQAGKHQRYFHENVQMNTHLFHAAQQAGVSRIIFASSINVIFGPLFDSYTHSFPRRLPLDGSTPANPGHPYGVGKTVTERLLAFMCQTTPITGIALRFPRLITDNDEARVSDWARQSIINDNAGYISSYFYLTHSQGAQVIHAALTAPLSGYHCYFPALLPLPTDVGPESRLIVDQAWPNVPWVEGVAACDANLVNHEPLIRELGWNPQPKSVAATA